jgi:predicted house-cleaning noncanonical NTP pyrophosphatase (MazG superfamily)
MDICTIKLRTHTKSYLDRYREYRNESYDEVVAKLISIVENVKKAPELSHDAVESIERARKRIKAGNFVTEEDAKKRLGL